MDQFGGPGSGGGDGDPHADDVWVAGVRLSASTLALVEGVRGTAATLGAAEADRFRRVARLAARCAADARAALAEAPWVPSTPSEAELVHTVVTHELMVVLGISKGHAESLTWLATRLTEVLPDTLDTLETGQIDLPRVRALAEETKLLDDRSARAVEAMVLPQVAGGDGPWQGLSPRAWRARVQRAVVQVDIDAARRRRETAIRLRAVRAWAQGDGTGVLRIEGRDTDIAFADRVITDLAHAWPAVGPDGEKLTMDQRRVDAVMDVFRRIADGDDLPWARIRREREIGLVLHADAFFGDGPAKNAPGELRGLGAPAPVDPRSAAEMARAEIDAGARTRVLLVGRDGTLQRTIRLPKAPPGGWTRDLLQGSVRKALPDLPSLHTEAHEPTAAITDHIHAVHPRCTSYDCARLASRCDLDHDESWPRGPTCVTNLSPRCRRHHELKTRALVRTRLHPDGSVTTTTRLGTTVTTRPEPLPGHGPGGAYARTYASGATGAGPVTNPSAES